MEDKKIFNFMAKKYPVLGIGDKTDVLLQIRDIKLKDIRELYRENGEFSSYESDKMGCLLNVIKGINNIYRKMDGNEDLIDSEEPNLKQFYNELERIVQR